MAQPQAPSIIPTSSSTMIMFADSPFLQCHTSSQTIQPNTRAIAHLTRDILQPVIVCPSTNSSDPSTSGPVANLKRKAPSSTSLNTRFGSFPHPTLLIPAGSQVRSSSSSGFIHILRPTPELWTTSLPHRTQVVYTPDSSYILHRLRARPGSRIIEAGAGSGSFTHAAVRAVYNGIHSQTTSTQTKVNSEGSGQQNGFRETEETEKTTGVEDPQGRVFSFEFHKDRTEILRHELKQHGLHDIVTVTNRDVCAGGFSVQDPQKGGDTLASAVFLDLPAPWLAIPHLTRESGSLSKTRLVRICCFSPCLEQALRTIAVLRESGWTEEELCEVAHKRLEVRRIGVNGREVGTKARGPVIDDEVKVGSVEDAVGKLKEQLWHRKTKQAIQKERQLKKRKLEEGNAYHEVDDEEMDDDVEEDDNDSVVVNGKDVVETNETKFHLFNQGRVIVRTEPELKTHTSYLVFAALPLPWTAEDEASAKLKYKIPPRPEPLTNPTTGKEYTSGFKPPRTDGKISKRQEKRLKRAADEAARKAADGDSKPQDDGGEV